MAPGGDSDEVDWMLSSVDEGPWIDHPGYVAVSKQSATVLKELGSPVVMVDHDTRAVFSSSGRPQYIYLVPGWIVDLWKTAERLRPWTGMDFAGGRRLAEQVVRAFMKMPEEDQRIAHTMVECVRNDPEATRTFVRQLEKGKWWNDDE